MAKWDMGPCLQGKFPQGQVSDMGPFQLGEKSGASRQDLGEMSSGLIAQSDEDASGTLSCGGPGISIVRRWKM